jgi:hypothetical protein
MKAPPGAQPKARNPFEKKTPTKAPEGPLLNPDTGRVNPSTLPYADLKSAFSQKGMQPGEREAIARIMDHRGVGKKEAMAIGARRTANGWTTAGVKGTTAMPAKKTPPMKPPPKPPNKLGPKRPGPGSGARQNSMGTR